MSTTLPTNYDWSSTQAPSGPFGSESIPGSESVLNNLSGLGALGSKGLDLSNLSRFAGSLGGLLGGGGSIEDIMKDTVKYFKKQSKKNQKASQ